MSKKKKKPQPICLAWQQQLARHLGELRKAGMGPKNHGVIVAVACVLVGFADPDGRGIRVGIRRLSDQSGFWPKTVLGALRWLEENGWLLELRKGSGTNPSDRRLVIPFSESADGSATPSVGPVTTLDDHRAATSVGPETTLDPPSVGPVTTLDPSSVVSALSGGQQTSYSGGGGGIEEPDGAARTAAALAFHAEVVADHELFGDVSWHKLMGNPDTCAEVARLAEAPGLYSGEATSYGSGGLRHWHLAMDELLADPSDAHTEIKKSAIGLLRIRLKAITPEMVTVAIAQQDELAAQRGEVDDDELQLIAMSLASLIDGDPLDDTDTQTLIDASRSGYYDRATESATDKGRALVEQMGKEGRLL